MEILFYSLALLATLVVVIVGKFPTSLSKTYYSVSDTFFEVYTWIMSTLLWGVALYSSNVYDNFLRPEDALYDSNGWWWIWNVLAAICFSGVGHYGRYESRQREEHYIFAGLSLTFAAIDVGGFETGIFWGSGFFSIVGATIISFFIAKKYFPKYKIIVAELVAIIFICIKNIIAVL